MNGLKWGVYVGSRDLQPPEVVWQCRYDAVVANLTAFPTGEVFGVGEKCCCLTMLSKQKGLLEPQSPTEFHKMPQLSFFATKYGMNALDL